MCIYSTLLTKISVSRDNKACDGLAEGEIEHPLRKHLGKTK